MYTRIMWMILRKLFKIACIIIVICMIVVAAKMASIELFNLDKIWPFNLFF